MEQLNNIFSECLRRKQKVFEKAFEKVMKGGDNNMETKSRYEVIADLEEKKRNLIIQKDSLDRDLKNHQRGLKELKRGIEDKEEEIKEFEESMEERKKTFDALIESVDDSLKRFGELNKKS